MNAIGDFDNLNARTREERSCKRCSRSLPLDRFPAYVYQGEVRQRHTCRDCRSKYEAERRRAHRAAESRERTTVLRSVVGRMVSQGNTRVGIARSAGLCERTVRRVLNGERDCFTPRTEARILEAYLEVAA